MVLILLVIVLVKFFPGMCAVFSICYSNIIIFCCPQIDNGYEEQTTLMEGLLFQTTYNLCKESKNSPVHYVAFEGNLY